MTIIQRHSVLTYFAFTFNGSAEATSYVAAGGRPLMTWLIGLDGVYRFSTGLDGRPLALRGTWTNEETFLLEYNSVASNDQMLLQFHFQGVRVAVDARERADTPGVQFVGHLQEP